MITINNYHCSREGFHMSWAQLQEVSSDSVKELSNQRQLTYIGHDKYMLHFHIYVYIK